MIMMWVGFWLFDALHGTKDSWWGFPFFVTFLALFGVEVLLYAIGGAILDKKLER